MMDSSDDTWVTVRVERVLYVHRGINVIICTDRDFVNGAELVLKLSGEAKERLFSDLFERR